MRMIGDATYPAIRSRHGVLRDFVPIYSLYQLTINLIVLGAFWWLFGADGHIATTAIFWLMLGWVYQYARRPSVMMVTVAQAEWLEAILHQQQYYDLDADGRWRTTAKNWYQRWPHQFIEFAPTSNGVTLIAPRDVMDAMRQGLELREEHGEVFFADDDRPFAFQPPEQPAIGWSMHAPGALIGVLCVIAWVWHMPTGGMTDWGVSGAALAQGRYETILLHMFAHGGLWHIVMNMSVLAAIGGPLVARFGPMPLSWLRFLTLFVLSGLSGAALYLLFHPSGTVPMLGASGALYGLIALFIRMPANGGALVPIRSAKIGRIGWDLVKQNVFLFVLLAVMSWSHAGNGGLAWEAHLGGFLFGLLAGPLLLPKSEEAASETLVRVG